MKSLQAGEEYNTSTQIKAIILIETQNAVSIAAIFSQQDTVYHVI